MHTYPYDRDFDCADAEARYRGKTPVQATPKASNTTQYPSPVHASEPHSWPRTQSAEPRINWAIEIREGGELRTEETVGGGKVVIKDCGSCWLPYEGEEEVVAGVVDCKGEEEKEADTGVGVGAPGLNEAASGSMKEKKLWDTECL